MSIVIVDASYPYPYDFPEPSKGTKGEHLTWERFPAGDYLRKVTKGINTALSLVRLFQGKIDPHFRKMAFGNTLSFLLHTLEITVYYCPQEIEGLSAFSKTYDNIIAITKWYLDNYSADYVAGTFIHECGHLNGVSQLGADHELAYQAPGICHLPSLASERTTS